MSLKIISSAFEDGGALPHRFTLDGGNVSPPLSWKGVPPKCTSLALSCEDRDAPVTARIQWVAYGIPSDLTSLGEGVPLLEELGDGIRQGWNDFHTIGCRGPAPNDGRTHAYRFMLYALDRALVFRGPVEMRDLRRAMNGTVLDRAHLTGTCSRRPRSHGPARGSRSRRTAERIPERVLDTSARSTSEVS